MKLKMLFTSFSLFAIFYASSAYSAMSCRKALFQENDIVQSNDFEVERTLLEYFSAFKISGIWGTDSLSRDLLSLGGNDQIIDFGSGEGAAVVDISADRNAFYRSIRLRAQSLFLKLHIRHQETTSEDQVYADMLAYAKSSGVDFEEVHSFLAKPTADRPQALGITYVMQTKKPASSKYSFLTGQLFENIPIKNIPIYRIGLSKIGIFSYTQKLSFDLSKALSRLQVGGRLYVYGMSARVVYPDELQKVSHDIQTNPKPTDHGLSVAEWLQQNAAGVQVHTGSGQKSDVVVIEKISPTVTMPVLEYQGQIGTDSQPPSYLFLSTQNQP